MKIRNLLNENKNERWISEMPTLRLPTSRQFWGRHSEFSLSRPYDEGRTRQKIENIILVKLCLVTTTGSWSSPLVPLVSSIKIEIGLRQDKRQQTALKRRSQEIKAFLIVLPLPPRPDRPDNCLIALGTIEPRCKGAREYRWAVLTPSYLVSKERQRLLLATKRSAHSRSFCSLLSSPSWLTSPEYLLSQLMSKLLSWHLWPRLVFDHNGDPWP